VDTPALSHLDLRLPEIIAIEARSSARVWTVLNSLDSQFPGCPSTAPTVKRERAASTMGGSCDEHDNNSDHSAMSCVRVRSQSYQSKTSNE
jgi:hypothetical protein